LRLHSGARPSSIREKAERNWRTKAEVDDVIRWLTGYSQASLETVIADRTSSPTSLPTPRR